MAIITRFGLAIGILLFIGLIIWQGTIDVIQLLLATGWTLLWLPLVWFPNLLPATQGWRLLLIYDVKPAFIHALLAMWMGRAVNNLLPTATIGGEIVKARLISLAGVTGNHAIASVVIDKTMQALSVAIWGIIGVCTLLLLSTNDELALYAALGVVILLFCTIGFLMVQQLGMLGILTTLGGKLIKTESWQGITFSAKEIDMVIMEIYRDKLRIVTAIFLKTLSLILQTGEVWLACYLLGHPIGLLEAVLLKSLATTLSDIAFIIPNAYGVQEGAYILVGAIIGLPADISLAVSLAIRIRDIVLDPAGLLTYQHIESKKLLEKMNNQPIHQ